MFICNFCKKPVKPNTACKKVVTQFRMYNHPHRSRVQKRWGFDKQGKKKLEWIDDKGNPGLQIVTEVNSCLECAVQHEKQQNSLTMTLKML